MSGSSLWYISKVQWSQALQQQRCNDSSLSYDLAGPRDQRVEHLYGWKPKESYHPNMFGSNIHCGIGDIMSSDLARPRNQSVVRLYRQKRIKVSHHPSKFGSHSLSGSGVKIVLVCHVITEDHVIKQSWVRAHHGKSAPCQVWQPQVSWQQRFDAFTG